MLRQKLGDYRRKVTSGDCVLTKFLDFEEQKQMLALRDNQTKVQFAGGYPDAERKRAMIAPADIDNWDQESFAIIILKARYDAKYLQVNHRNILGHIMQLGIERNTFGDIYVSDTTFYIFATKEMAAYLQQNFTSLHHQMIELVEVDAIEELVEKVEQVEQINVASLRLDAIVARTLRISRSESLERIEGGLVMVNHKECLHSSYQCKVGDMLSIRKFGRIMIRTIIKSTKKDRLILEIGVKH